MPSVLAFSLRACLLIASCLIAAGAWAQIIVRAPEPLDALLRQHLQAPDMDARGAALDAFARETRKVVADLLATEGYFSPGVTVSAEPGRMRVEVDPGARTTIADVAIDIEGDLTRVRRAELLAAWPLKASMPFRDAEWNEAKQTLLRRLLEVDFPDAQMTQSRAEIDPASATARLHVTYVTGPRYVFGDLQISGLSRYDTNLVQRYSRIEPGQRYEQRALLALQAALQNAPYFQNVSVELDRGHATGSGPLQAPVKIHVSERAPYRVSLGAGASSDTGAQAELLFQSFDFLQRAWQLDTGMRLEQLRQRYYADVRLPPQGNQRDSFGTLVDSEDLQGLLRHRLALGAVRTFVADKRETRYAVNWQREYRSPNDAPRTTSTALTLDGLWIWREVDDVFFPRRGYTLRAQAGGGAKGLLSDQNFLRLYTRYQHYLPVGTRDVFTLRGELGATLAPSRKDIPEDFLFRAGGSESVRGYDYRSLGVQEGSATVGGRYLATASAEYTHWLTPTWGAAAFVDAGDASDDRSALDMAVGYGIGARWRSPAGPLAVDLAYGRRDEKLRLHFSLAIAF